MPISWVHVQTGVRDGGKMCRLSTGKTSEATKRSQGWNAVVDSLEIQREQAGASQRWKAGQDKECARAGSFCITAMIHLVL